MYKSIKTQDRLIIYLCYGFLTFHNSLLFAFGSLLAVAPCYFPNRTARTLLIIHQPLHAL